ncbi:MAG TPA: hydrogenase nickel incorporation protein HypB [Nocardioidaceae bacterium]|nr:hydrogenase nickel incorporation protein HypB [Nocardioidaceae bacterium]
MCSTCGCGEGGARVSALDERGRTYDDHHDHDHGPGAGAHGHGSPVPPESGTRTHTLELEVAVLAKNDELAAANRSWLAARRITAVNLMSSPGAGKTTLLERTIQAATRSVSVVEGDQETLFDARRIRQAGARAVQVNTGAGCHLDAAMVARALARLGPDEDSVLFIENVGNLVCPALFDLGEKRKVVVVSVTEGDDKPLKYPHMFAAADVVVLNKTDLLPYVDFDTGRFTADARSLNRHVEVLPVSARTGANLEAWYEWLG